MTNAVVVYVAPSARTMWTPLTHRLNKNHTQPLEKALRLIVMQIVVWCLSLMFICFFFYLVCEKIASAFTTD